MNVVPFTTIAPQFISGMVDMILNIHYEIKRLLLSDNRWEKNNTT